MSIKTASLGAASLLAMMAVAGTAFADGMPSRGRIADAPAPRTCSTTGNVGLTTDYVFRGISQTMEDPALQGGVDFTCGRFYAGVWASNVDFGAVSPIDVVGNLEIDIYGGFKHSTGPVTWDVGFIYYAYPGQPSGTDLEDVFELKLGASGDVWKGGTLSGTVFYNPEDDIVTLEGTIAHVLPRLGMFTPTVSATLGNVRDDDDDYTYWNIGLTAGFLEKWSLDVRYWDTDIDGGIPVGSGVNIADERFVGTIKYTF